MDEFLAVSETLSSEDVKEDKNNDIIGNTWWVLNDAVSNQKNGSDILETVACQKESNTGSFNGITEDWFNFFVNSTFIIDGLDVFNKGQKFSFSFNIIGVLRIR